MVSIEVELFSICRNASSVTHGLQDIVQEKSAPVAVGQPSTINSLKTKIFTETVQTPVQQILKK